MRIDELLNIFFKECGKKKSLATVGHYKRRMRYFREFLQTIKVKTLSGLTHDIFERYERSLNTKGISDNTRYVYMETPKRFMQFLYEYSYTLINYAEQIKLPKWRRDPRPSAYKKAQFPDMVKSVYEAEPKKSRDRAILSLYVFENLKTGEIEKLTVMDLELDEFELRLASKKRFHRLKEETIKYIKRYVSNRNLFKPKTDYLFTTNSGIKLSAERVRFVLKKAVRYIHNKGHYG